MSTHPYIDYFSDFGGKGKQNRIPKKEKNNLPLGENRF